MSKRLSKQVRAWQEVEREVVALTGKYQRSRTYRVSYGMTHGNDISVTMYGPSKPMQGCVGRLHDRLAEFEALLKRLDMNYICNHVADMYTQQVDPKHVSVTFVVIAGSEVRKEYQRRLESFNRHFA